MSSTIKYKETRYKLSPPGFVLADATLDAFSALSASKDKRGGLMAEANSVEVPIN